MTVTQDIYDKVELSLDTIRPYLKKTVATLK